MHRGCLHFPEWTGKEEHDLKLGQVLRATTGDTCVRMEKLGFSLKRERQGPGGGLMERAHTAHISLGTDPQDKIKK